MRLKSTLIAVSLCLALGIGAAMADDLNEGIILEITEAADATFDDADGLDLERAYIAKRCGCAQSTARKRWNKLVSLIHEEARKDSSFIGGRCF